VTGYDFYISDDISIDEKAAAAETATGVTVTAFSEFCAAHNIYAVFGMAEKESGMEETLYNSAFAIGPKGLIGVYRKIHPFGDENKVFNKGNCPFFMETPWGKVSVGICYDTYQFPELLRYYVWKGSRLYLNPTALVEEIQIPNSREAFIEYYKTSLDYAVLCNTIYVASANLCGKDRMNCFGGGSVVMGPVLSPFYETRVGYYAGSTDNASEGIFTAQIDLSFASRRLCNVNSLTGTPDFRPDLYKQFLWQ
jgi:predicted amidohydrolase